MKDVTKLVDCGEVDGEFLALTKCVCGKKFEHGDQSIGIYKNDPWKCPNCGVEMIVQIEVRVYKL